MKRKTEMSKIAVKASTIKINTKLNSMEEAPFFDNKMEKAIKILSKAGLPK